MPQGALLPANYLSTKTNTTYNAKAGGSGSMMGKYGRGAMGFSGGSSLGQIQQALEKHDLAQRSVIKQARKDINAKWQQQVSDDHTAYNQGERMKIEAELEHERERRREEYKQWRRTHQGNANAHSNTESPISWQPLEYNLPVPAEVQEVKKAAVKKVVTAAVPVTQVRRAPLVRVSEPVDVLLKLSSWLRLRGWRVIDLFRSRSMNSSFTGNGRSKLGGKHGQPGTGMGGDDLISRKEFKSILTHLDLRLTTMELTQLMDFLDGNNDGEIDLQELTSAIRNARRGQSHKRGLQSEPIARMAQQLRDGKRFEDVKGLHGGFQFSPTKALQQGSHDFYASERRKGGPLSAPPKGPGWFGGTRNANRLPPAETNAKFDKHTLQVLCTIEKYLTTHRMRALDLFRSNKVNSTGSDVSVSPAKRSLVISQSSWLGASDKAQNARDETLDVKELSQLLLGLDCRLSRQEVMSVIQILDRNGDGEVDHEELAKALRIAKRAKLLL
jgi:Ca2+-binding EF-hand superfamily protein